MPEAGVFVGRSAAEGEHAWLDLSAIELVEPPRRRRQSPQPAPVAGAAAPPVAYEWGAEERVGDERVADELVGDALAADDEDWAPAHRGEPLPGRRTITITGRGPDPRRRTVRPHERSGFRPDRAGLWAVLLGLLLILIAVSSAHAAVVHPSAAHAVGALALHR